MNKIRVLLADDHPVLRVGLRTLIDAEPDMVVVGEAANGEEAVARTAELWPDVVVMDIAMPLLNGLQATCQILKTATATKVLMLSAHSDDEYVKAATNSGAMGYLIKQTIADTVCPAIREVHKGNTFFSASIPSRLYKRKRKKQMR